MVKNTPASAEDARGKPLGSVPGWGRSLEEGWQPTAVFSLVKYHGQRSLVGYKEDRKESDVTEHPATHTHTHTDFDKLKDLTSFYVQEAPVDTMLVC